MKTTQRSQLLIISARLIVVLGLAFILLSCQTNEDEKRQAKSNELLILDLQDKLAAAQADLEAAQTKVADLENQVSQFQGKTGPELTKLQARVKELEEQKSHLEDVLTQLQLLRLGGQPIVTDAIQTKQSTRETPRPTAGDSLATPAPDLRLPDSATVPLEGDEMRLMGTTLQNRKDRAAVRGTPLFSERDSQTGQIWYFHRSYWYDKPGIFIEIVRKPDLSYQAHLVTQSQVEAKSPTNDFGKLVFSKAPLADGSPAPVSDFGFPSVRNYLLSKDSILESLVYDLDALAISRLLQALNDPEPQYSVIRPDAAVSAPTQTLEPAKRKALLEMLQAYRDLRTAP